MNILHAGNMANLGYVIARQLRKDGINADLLLEKNPPKGSNPFLFDTELNNSYPDWFYFYDKKNSNWKKQVIAKMREDKYDLVHAYVEMPILAYLSRRPFIAHTQGSDFREMAFSKTLRGVLLRRAYKKAKVVLFFQPDHYSLFSKLKLNNGIFLPPLWATEYFKPIEKNDERYSGKFIVFHPANLEWRLKGNDILVKGFAEFVKNYPNSVLVIVDRGIDSGKTHKLVGSLGIESTVSFIKGPLDASQLLHYYSISDVIADQFVLGSLGSIGWEAFSCAKPLLAYVNEPQYLTLYGEPPPIVNAQKPKEISGQLEFLTDQKIRKKIGMAGREWVTKHHSQEVFSRKIRLVYELILEDKKVDKIRSHLSELSSSGS